MLYVRYPTVWNLDVSKKSVARNLYRCDVMESSIDIFGRSNSRGGGGGKRGPRGPVGPRGPPGDGSIENIVRWFPKMVTVETRYNEFCCLKISDPAADLFVDEKSSAIKRWNSTASESKIFAASLENFFSKKYNLVNEEKGIYALNLNGGNAYRIDDVELFPYQKDNQWVWSCITFRLLDDGDGGEQYLFSNYAESTKKEFRGLSVTEKSIKIWGCDEKPPNRPFVNVVTSDSLINKWCTVFVCWSDVDIRKGKYIVLVQGDDGERIRGEFLCQQFTSMFQQDFIDFFCIHDVEKGHKITHGFHGDVAFFELYIQKNATEATYPDNFCELVVQSQSIIV